jgi:hypothetical protein
MKLKSKYINYNIRFLKLLLYDLNKKGKKVHAVFYQVGFILILYGEYNGN